MFEKIPEDGTGVGAGVADGMVVGLGVTVLIGTGVADGFVTAMGVKYDVLFRWTGPPSPPDGFGVGVGVIVTVGFGVGVTESMLRSTRTLASDTIC